MANEIANISQAGLVLQVFEENESEPEGNPPAILGSWGVIESTLVALTSGGDNTGEYQIRLVQPGSGIPVIFNSGNPPVINGYSSVSQLLQWSGYFQDEDFQPEPTEGQWACDLIHDPAGPVPVVGKTISLPILRMRMFEEGLGAENGILSVQVNQIPQG